MHNALTSALSRVLMEPEKQNPNKKIKSKRAAVFSTTHTPACGTPLSLCLTTPCSHTSPPQPSTHMAPRRRSIRRPPPDRALSPGALHLLAGPVSRPVRLGGRGRGQGRAAAPSAGVRGSERVVDQPARVSPPPSSPSASVAGPPPRAPPRPAPGVRKPRPRRAVRREPAAAAAALPTGDTAPPLSHAAPRARRWYALASPPPPPQPTGAARSAGTGGAPPVAGWRRATCKQRWHTGASLSPLPARTTAPAATLGRLSPATVSAGLVPAAPPHGGWGRAAVRARGSCGALVLPSGPPPASGAGLPSPSPPRWGTGRASHPLAAWGEAEWEGAGRWTR